MSGEYVTICVSYLKKSQNNYMKNHKEKLISKNNFLSKSPILRSSFTEDPKCGHNCSLNYDDGCYGCDATSFPQILYSNALLIIDFFHHGTYDFAVDLLNIQSMSTTTQFEQTVKMEFSQKSEIGKWICGCAHDAVFAQRFGTPDSRAPVSKQYLSNGSRASSNN